VNAGVEPATEALLAQMRAGGGRPLYEMSVDEVRAMVVGSSAALAGPRIEVGSAVDRTLPTATGDVRVRVYTPTGPDRDALPLVVYFHGGGFVAGDLDTGDGTARYLCQNSHAVLVSVDYRRPPEHKFPAAVDDALAVVEWVSEHAGELGGDAERLAVAGESAGGNLAAVVCQLARAQGPPRIAYQVLCYPVMDFTFPSSPSRAQFGGGDYFLSNRDMEWFRDHYLEKPEQASDPRVSPLKAPDVSGLPPALIIAAECDLHTDEGRAYADRLSAAGVPVEYRCFSGTIHAFMAFSGAIPLGRDGLAFTAARVRSALHG
jgi:acetyl esterase